MCSSSNRLLLLLAVISSNSVCNAIRATGDFTELEHETVASSPPGPESRKQLAKAKNGTGSGSQRKPVRRLGFAAKAAALAVACSGLQGCQLHAGNSVLAAPALRGLEEVAQGGGLEHIGFNYATGLQSKPLNPARAANLFAARFPKVKKVKFFHHDHGIMEHMQALSLHGVRDFVIAIPNYELHRSTVSPAFAQQFVSMIYDKVTKNNFKITIAIGNEPFADWNHVPQQTLLDAYTRIRKALEDRALHQRVKITVPFQAGILENTWPPFAANFKGEFQITLKQLCEKMLSDGSYFEMNLYPYLARKYNPRDISLEYALGDSQTSATDSAGKLHTWRSLLHAQLDSARAALTRLDPRFSKLPVVVGETGWPSQDNSFGDASPRNAKKYYDNALKLGESIYFFEVFDEGKKSGDSGAGSQSSNVENHWGFLTEDGSAKFGIPDQMA